MRYIIRGQVLINCADIDDFQTQLDKLQAGFLKKYADWNLKKLDELPETMCVIQGKNKNYVVTEIAKYDETKIKSGKKKAAHKAKR